jgi:hypothetical protein
MCPSVDLRSRTATTRAQHSRAGLRYTTDATDAGMGIPEAMLRRAAGRG